MGTIFFILSALFFFFAAIGVGIIPNPTAWGLCALAIGHLTGGWIPWRKPTA